MICRAMQACRIVRLAQGGKQLLAKAACRQPPGLAARAPRPLAAAEAAAAAIGLPAAGGWQRCHLAGWAAAPPGGRQQRATKVQAAAAGSDSEEAEEDDDSAAGIVGELGEGEDAFLDDWEESEENVGPQLSTGGVTWGEQALAVAQQLLEGGQGELADIQLFSFRAIPSSKRLDIRLDKMTDKYGSPSLEDVATFSRAFNAAFEAAVGEATAGAVEVEVSSPGAERQVRVPGELERFGELPMKVEYSLEEDKVDTKVLSFVEYDAAVALTRWRLADVRVNRTGGKGRGLNRKQRDTVYELPLSALRCVNLHIDF